MYNLRTAPDAPLVAYGSHELEVLAQFEATIAIAGLEADPLRTPRIETISVCANTQVSLMSRSTAEYFKVLKLGPLELNNITERAKPFPMVPNYVVSFDIDHSVPGHIDMTLRIPLAQRAEQKKLLMKYEELGIIERVPVTENPKFESPKFFVKKANGTLRLVNDNKEANKALRPISYSMPTLEGFLLEFAGYDTYSLADISDAFLHLPLDRESRKMQNLPKRSHISGHAIEQGRHSPDIQETRGSEKHASADKNKRVERLSRIVYIFLDVHPKLFRQNEENAKAYQKGCPLRMDRRDPKGIASKSPQLELISTRKLSEPTFLLTHPKTR